MLFKQLIHTYARARTHTRTPTHIHYTGNFKKILFLKCQDNGLSLFIT
jgi:hypothetical protein